MGADYYQCNRCDTGFNADSDYAVFCECGACFCCQSCAKPTNYGPWVDEKSEHRIDPNKEITCMVCRKEIFTDTALLKALMKHYKLTQKQVIEIAKNGE